jgi:anaerobic selenocysteine-containing dehydrogenase
VGDARSNPEVFASLGRAMGFDDAPFHWDSAEYVERVGAAVRHGEARADVETLAGGRTEPVKFSGGHPVQFTNVFPRTSDGKVHLAPPQLGAAPYTYRALDSEYPLALITPATARLISSTCGEFNGMVLEVTLHPSDAAKRNISAGNSVRVFNDLGEVHCQARVSASIRSGVVSMPKGAWRSWSANGLSPTALCPAHVSEVGDGACFNDARVEIQRA